MKKLLCLFLFVGFFGGDLTIPEATAQVGNKYYYGKRQGPHNHRWVWTKRRRYYSVGLTLGAKNYFGDIAPRQSFTSTDLAFTRPAIGFDLQKRFRPQWSWEISLSYGRIAADDKEQADPMDEDDQFRYVRNLHFRNDVFSAAFQLQYDFIAREKMNKEFYDRPKQFIPYITGGVAVVFHDPQAKSPELDYQGGDPQWEPNQWVALQPLGTEGQGRVDPRTGRSLGERYSTVQVAFPLGVGVRKRLGQRFDLSFEFNYYFFLTDYLDDVSKSYVDPGVFTTSTNPDDEVTATDFLAQALHDRSEPYNTARIDGVTQRQFPTTTYVGVDGTTYTSYQSFGQDQFPDVIRGNTRDNDVFTVTGFTLRYLIPREGVRCPIRFR